MSTCPPELAHFLENIHHRVFPGSHRFTAPVEIGRGGSRRRFFRVGEAPCSLVGMLSEDPPADSRGVTENDAFLYLAGHLAASGAAVPAVYDHRLDRGWFALEDVGDTLLYDRVRYAGLNREVNALYERVLGDLAIMHHRAGRGFDPERTPNPDYRGAFVRRFESGYFHEWCLGAVFELTVPGLDRDFDTLAAGVDAWWTPHFLYRDFQSQNVAVPAGTPRYLDFQGGRRGPRQYDVASLLLDPYTALPRPARERLLTWYLGRSRALDPAFDPDEFRRGFPLIAVHRLMQALGAYGFLSLKMGKTHFRAHIPAAVGLLAELTAEYPERETVPVFVDTVARLARTVTG